MPVVDDSLRTTDPDEAERLVRRIYPDARINESRRPFSYRHRVRGDERVVFARFSISAWTDIRVHFDRVLGVGHVLAGTYQATSNGVAIDPHAPFLLRPGEGRSQSERLALLMVNLDEDALGRFAGHWDGVDAGHLRFPAVAPRQPGGGPWPNAVRYVREVFETPELLANDLLRASAVDALYATAIAAFPIEVVGPSAPPGGTLPSTVRRAVAYIDDNVDAPIRIEDVAQAARLSVRGLQGAFQRHLGTTPGRALRAARLSAARTDLLAADPAVDSVTAIARRYGFYHLGRFAAEYRAQYGELPSATLQRDG